MIKFPIILRWNEATQQWRMLDAKHETHLQEFPLYECRWFLAKMIEPLKLSRDQDNFVEITLSKY